MDKAMGVGIPSGRNTLLIGRCLGHWGVGQWETSCNWELSEKGSQGERSCTVFFA